MADDPVETAKRALIAVVNPAHGMTAERVLLNIDALIAAVRAEAAKILLADCAAVEGEAYVSVARVAFNRLTRLP